MSADDSEPSQSSSPDINVESDGEGSQNSDEGEDTELGLKSLLNETSNSSNEGDNKTDNNDLINDAAAIAESIQPKGNTLSSTSVSTFKE